MPDAITPVPLSLQTTDEAAFAAALGAAFSRYGFAVVSGHDLPPALTEAAAADARAFFALPDAVKRAYHQPGGGGQRGYTPFGIEAAKGADQADLKEFWHVGRDLPAGHPYRAVMPDNVWPTEVAGFREHVGALYAALDDLGRRVLRAVALHLGLAADYFDAPTALGNSVLRLLHYPPVSAEAPGVRAGAHEDINVITLLLGAEEAGLELLTREGEWLAVNPPPGAVVCNIGDMLQRLTGGALPSTTHRVVNPPPERRGTARYSTPFFLHFAPDFLITPLGGGDRAGEDAAPITAEAFLQKRLREIRLI